VAACERAWAVAVQALARPDVALVVLDELNVALRYEYLDIERVLADINARPQSQHVVVTGRNARQPMLDAADLVTEMTLVKHHFKAGIKAQEGVEF
jgi:cob(I)alamin adenosyltransferase